MYVGHVALAVGATSRRPDIPLSVLVTASLAPDLMVAPLWHTLPFTALLVVGAFGVGAWAWDRRAGVVLALLVVSHFLVDLVTSELDVWPNSDVEVGLALYDLPVADFAVEAAVIAVGWSLWRRAVRPRPDDARSMLLLLLISQAVFDAFVSSSANGG